MDNTASPRNCDDLENHLRQVIDGVNLVAVMLDLEGRVLYCNEYFLRVFGFRKEEVLGNHWLDLVVPDNVSIRAEFHARLRKLDIPTHDIVPIRTRDGTERVVSWNTSILRDASGKAFAMASIGEDITAWKRDEEAIQRTQRLDSLGLLAGGIAHDFNNLLGAIFGRIDLALTEDDDDSRREHLAKAMGTLDRARALTQQLLTFAKGGAPIREVLDIRPFVSEVLNFALSGSNVVATFTHPETPLLCSVDKHQMGQVIDNIVINAIQAMPTGGTIEVHLQEAAVHDKSRPSGVVARQIEISFTDHGGGIPKENLQRIFDPFFTTKPGGHGLGLSTSHSIVRRHGGCIEVESEVGKGSTFRICLPGTHEAPAATFEKNPKVAPPRSGRVYFMDDDPSVRDCARLMLESLGYTAVCLEDGNKTIEILRKELGSGSKIAAIILDITIPGGMGGMEAVKVLRGLSPGVPVIVTSGYSEDPVMATPEDYGFDASLAKPFTRAELADLLSRHTQATEKGLR